MRIFYRGIIPCCGYETLLFSRFVTRKFGVMREFRMM